MSIERRKDIVKALEEANAVFGRSDDRIEQAAEEPGSEPWPEPDPLGSKLPAVARITPDMPPDALRPMAEDVARRTQVPLDFAAVTAIAVLAGVTDRRAPAYNIGR